MRPRHRNDLLLGSRWERSPLPSNRRPAILIVLCLVILFISFISVSGLIASFRIPDLPISLPYWYLYLRNGLWGLGSVIAAMGLFLGRSWSLNLTRWGSLFISLWYWSDRLLLSRSDYARRSWPAGVVVTLIVLIWIFWILTRPAIQCYFRENES